MSSAGAMNPNRISSPRRPGSDSFVLDRRTRSVIRVPRRTALSCSPNCNLQIRSNISTVQIGLLLPDWLLPGVADDGLIQPYPG